MAVSNDQELINQIKKKGRFQNEALKVIYERNFPKISHFVFQHSGSEADAKDVFQESIIVFHKMIAEDTYRNEAKIDSVIYAISRNIWYQRLKKRKGLDDLSLVEKTHSEEIVFDWEGFSKERFVRKLVRKLTPDCQKIIHLFYYESRSMSDLQAEFKLGSIQAMKNKKYRCMKDLMDIFRKNKATLDSL